MGISLKTRKLLWGRSGSKCALPSCRKSLFEDETLADDASVVGDEAHIVAREKDGPRGDYPLGISKRDSYDNLILMCKVHHKMIDDQVIKYSVDVLRQMKKEHIEWVNKNLSPDTDKQRDEVVYATYIDKWVDLANIDNWKEWTSFIFGSGQPQIYVDQYDKLRELDEYIFSRVWPKRYDKIEQAFSNFRLVLSDFLMVFDKYKEKLDYPNDPLYNTEKIYHRVKGWDEKEYNRLLDKFEFHVDLVQDLGLELTRAGNFICDQIRNYLSNSFKIEEGVLLIETGPDMNLGWVTIRLEYKSNNFEDINYLGLKNFMETRCERGRCFGKGISEDYFPIKFY